jgi:hypothetical protein
MCSPTYKQDQFVERCAFWSIDTPLAVIGLVLLLSWTGQKIAQVLTNNEPANAVFIFSNRCSSVFFRESPSIRRLLALSSSILPFLPSSSPCHSFALQAYLLVSSPSSAPSSSFQGPKQRSPRFIDIATLSSHLTFVPYCPSHCPRLGPCYSPAQR